jgi:hypothetical protein
MIRVFADRGIGDGAGVIEEDRWAPTVRSWDVVLGSWKAQDDSVVARMSEARVEEINGQEWYLVL